MSGTNLA